MSTVAQQYIEARIERVPESGCWLWTQALTPPGYGVAHMYNKTLPAHRVSYQAFVAPVPKELFVCHKCDVRCCVNPTHLFLGTQRDNIRDASRKGRLATGFRNGAYTKPHRVRRGATHGARTKPERWARGERNGFAKLTAEQVLAIRASSESERQCAKRFGVVRATVHFIRHRVTWRHLK